MAPSWFQHPDLMNLIIILCLAIIAWFIRRDLSRFNRKLDSICESKADKKDMNKIADDQKIQWKRINTHGHDIECDGTSCKPVTKAVLLHDEGTS
jgi:hypothetical protein